MSETRKGTIAHVRPLHAHIAAASLRAMPAWVVLPRFQAGAETQFRPMSKAHAGLWLARNAFNFSLLGETGFSTLNRAIESCTAFEMDYGDLDTATKLFAELADGE